MANRLIRTARIRMANRLIRTARTRMANRLIRTARTRMAKSDLSEPPGPKWGTALPEPSQNQNNENEMDSGVPASGILEVMPDGFGFHPMRELSSG